MTYVPPTLSLHLTFSIKDRGLKSSSFITSPPIKLRCLAMLLVASCQRVNDALESTNAFDELWNCWQQTKSGSLQSHSSGAVPGACWRFGELGLVFTGAGWCLLVCNARLGLPFAPKGCNKGCTGRRERTESRCSLRRSKANKEALRGEMVAVSIFQPTNKLCSTAVNYQRSFVHPPHLSGMHYRLTHVTGQPRRARICITRVIRAQLLDDACGSMTILSLSIAHRVRERDS